MTAASATRPYPSVHATKIQLTDCGVPSSGPSARTAPGNVTTYPMAIEAVWR